MIRFIAISLLLVCGPAVAVICKTVDAQGNVSYANVPAGECQQKVRLPPDNRYQPRPVGSDALAGDKGGDTADEALDYSEAKIVQPEPGGTVRNNEGKVPVSVTLQPPLQQGHRLRLFIDGVQLQPDFDGQSIILSDVERGTHELEIQLLDRSGRLIRTIGPQSFTMRKASLFSPARP